MAGRFWHVFNSKMTKEAQRLQKMGESVLSVPYFARTFRERDKELDKVIRHGQPMTLGEGRGQGSFNPLGAAAPGFESQYRSTGKGRLSDVALRPPGFKTECREAKRN